MMYYETPKHKIVRKQCIYNNIKYQEQGIYYSGQASKNV